MICAIVLAAGRSTRMSVQKLLLPFGSSTVVGTVVDAVSRPPVDRTIVVTAPGGDVAAALAGRDVTLVVNPDPAAEMLDSVRIGLRALPPACEAVLVTPGDLPGVTPGLVASLVAAFRASGKGIVVPVYDGGRGHPLLLGARYFAEVLTRYDDVGLRGLPRAHQDDVLEVVVVDDAVLADIDTPEDYERVRRLNLRSEI